MTRAGPKTLHLTKASLVEGARTLQRMDPALGAWIERIGPVGLRRHRHRFGALCRAIISQQLGAGAARSIHLRFLALFAPDRRPHAGRLLELSTPDLRASGLSARKVDYLRALGREFHEGRLRRVQFSALENEEVIALLTELPGIGRWTAEMFLIFSLGRMDVFSVGDLALRNAVQRVRGRSLDPGGIERAAEKWSPFRSVASLYLWKIAHWKDAE